MDIILVLKNKKGGTILWILIAVILLALGIITYFSIKNYQIQLLLNKDKFTANKYASETLYRKYTFLIKNIHPANWRVGILTELYDFTKCLGSGINYTDCTLQSWNLAKIPYTISYTIDGTNYIPIPKTLTYNYNGTITYVEGNITKNAENWKGIRIENIPIGYNQNDLTKKVYCQVLLIEKDIGGDSAIIPVDIFINTFHSPIFYQ